jgi:hypothetical protein
MTERWEMLSLPILEWVAEREPINDAIDLAEISSATGYDDRQVRLEIRRLREGSYLDGQSAWGGGLLRPRLLERGLRAVGEWPSDDPYAELLATIDERIAATSGEERSRLTRLRNALVDVGQDVGKSVLVAMIKGQLGL